MQQCPVKPMLKHASRLFTLSFASAVMLTVVACGEEVPSDPSAYPDAGSSAARLYYEKCADCHVAPQPTVHTANRWPGIVQRMQMRMQANAREPLDKNELTVILDYLERHARVDNQ